MSELSSSWVLLGVTCSTTVVVVTTVSLLVYFLIGGTVYHDLPSGYLINTKGCRIPYLDPFDPSIQEFIFEEEDTACMEKYGMALVESNLTALFINESALSYYNITDVKDLRCCYTPFWRDSLNIPSSGIDPEDEDTQIRFSTTCTPFSGEVEVHDEFIKVQCYLNSDTSHTSIYTDFHAFTPLKKKKNLQLHDPLSNGSVSVLIVGLDAVSRLNLHRQMPLTVKFLKETLNAVELLGYNKVADNTFPNVIPVLTGFSDEELKESCWPSWEYVFDDCNYIWDKYRVAGYMTALAEDATNMSIFNHYKRGFRLQPTDYYARPFIYTAEAEIGHYKRMNSKLCVGPRKTLENLLQYIYKCVVTMKDVLSFSFIWGSSLTHDILNLPKKGDRNQKEFLERLYSEKIFDRSILVFMSDHGIRYGDIRKTYQGYLEERLPFLFIAYPNWFGQKFTTAVDNLRNNSKKLTTPFDLHETLLDLVLLTRLEADVLRTRTQDLGKTSKLPRGISLFLPIPDSRTCDDAGISDHWCTCHRSESVLTTDIRVVGAANFLLDHINLLVKDYPNCARLELLNISNAREEKATSFTTFKTSDGGLTDFSVTIETIPGNALFESTVRYNENEFKIVGTVSRINVFGKQSDCIAHENLLKLYCYCT